MNIETLYSKIPGFACKPGCTDCCGPVPFSKLEWDRVQEKRMGKGMDCPYANTASGCDVYDQRPLICRLFGAVEDERLECPHGCGPEVRLSEAEGRILVRAYHEQFMGD